MEPDLQLELCLFVLLASVNQRSSFPRRSLAAGWWQGRRGVNLPVMGEPQCSDTYCMQVERKRRKYNRGDVPHKYHVVVQPLMFQEA